MILISKTSMESFEKRTVQSPPFIARDYETKLKCELSKLIKSYSHVFFGTIDRTVRCQ